MKSKTQITQPPRARATNSGAPARRQQANLALAPPPLARQTAGAAWGAAHAVCSITDPFCDNARGSKWPDRTASQTLSVPVRMREQLYANSIGDVGSLYTANYVCGIVHGTIDSVNKDFVANLAPGPAIDLVEYVPNFPGASQFRVVSAGIRVSTVTSAMNSQGIVTIIEVPPARDIADIQRIPTLSKAVPSYESMPVRSHDGLYGVMRPMGATAREFSAVDVRDAIPLTDPFSFSTHDWSSLLVVVAGGAPNELIAIVDIFLNIEVTIQPNNAMGFITTSPAQTSDQLTRISNDLLREAAIFRGTDRTVDETFLRRAHRAVVGAGTFVYENRKSIGHLVGAAANMYGGNPAGAGGHLLMLADQPRSVD